MPHHHPLGEAARDSCRRSSCRIRSRGNRERHAYPTREPCRGRQAGSGRTRPFPALIETLAEGNWRRPTACPAWDVRQLVAHVVGAAATFASWSQFGRQGNPTVRPLPTDMGQRVWVGGLRVRLPTRRGPNRGTVLGRAQRQRRHAIDGLEHGHLPADGACSRLRLYGSTAMWASEAGLSAWLTDCPYEEHVRG